MKMNDREVHAWLDHWAQAIRNGDFAAGRSMFSEDVVAFGTVAGAVSGIDALMTQQWERVWPRTTGFTFGPPLVLAMNDDIAVVAVEWRSEGRTDSGNYDRKGRATLVLRSIDDNLLCTHSHFSMVPGTVALRDESGGMEAPLSRHQSQLTASGPAR